MICMDEEKDNAQTAEATQSEEKQDERKMFKMMPKSPWPLKKCY